MTRIEDLYQQYGDLVYNYLLKLSRNESLAEELVKETFYRAYMNLKNFRGDGKISVWLCQIAKNLYFAWYREQKRMLPLSDSEEARETENFTEEIEDQLLAGKLRGYLHDLEEPYKEVLMLRIYAQVPLKEISLLFGKTESWARVTFYRGKQKLLDKMEGEML